MIKIKKFQCRPYSIMSVSTLTNNQVCFKAFTAFETDRKASRGLITLSIIHGLHYANYRTQTINSRVEAFW